MANPTFSWSPPVGVTVDGYGINIFQNDLVSNVPPFNNGVVFSTTLAPNIASYTVTSSSNFAFMPNTDYTFSIVALQTRDGSTSNLTLNNINDRSDAYFLFRLGGDV
jgi:hypothetical protein